MFTIISFVMVYKNTYSVWTFLGPNNYNK